MPSRSSNRPGTRPRMTDAPVTPTWIQDAIFYQIFPDRFALSDKLEKPPNLQAWDAPPTSNAYKGGDLLGVIERLGWLTELGVNAIYFNPVFQSASNHRYHTHDYFRVDPLLGGDEVFDRLLEACRERGIRVVLDGVFNHASRGFLQFNDLLENGAESPWVDWFHVQAWPLRAYRESEPPNYSAWWGLHALPKFNTENRQVREFIMRVAEHWIRRGADGWRLDVPEEIKTDGFWEEFRRRVKSANPEAYLVGEIWGDASGWTNRAVRFDGTMNYLFTGAVLSFAAGKRIRDEVVEGANYQVRPPKDANAYADAIDCLFDRYDPASMRSNLNLLSSHDTPRAITAAGGDVDSMILAALLLFTFPGPPCVYYGEEIGLEGARDPDCRRGFPWDKPDSWNRDLLQAYKSLIALRRDHAALRRGDYRRLWPVPGGESSTLYVLGREEGEDVLLVAVNAGDEAESASLNDLREGGFKVAWGEAEIGSGRLIVPARKGVVLSRIR